MRLVKFDCTNRGNPMYINPDLVTCACQEHPRHTKVTFVHGPDAMIYEDVSEVAKKLKYNDDE